MRNLPRAAFTCPPYFPGPVLNCLAVLAGKLVFASVLGFSLRQEYADARQSFIRQSLISKHSPPNCPKYTSFCRVLFTSHTAQLPALILLKKINILLILSFISLRRYFLHE
jgi:hypothetical protein